MIIYLLDHLILFYNPLSDVFRSQRTRSATEELAASKRFFSSGYRERFFDEMGMDRDTLEPMLIAQLASDKDADWTDVIESLTDVPRGGYVETEQIPVRVLFAESQEARNEKIHKWLEDVRKAANSSLF